MKISVVIPTKNEEATLEPILTGCLKHADEVLLIDGHSTDRTREIAAQYGVPIHLDRGKGKGDAMKLAISLFTGDILVYIDADGSHDPDDIPRLVQPIRDNTADMVIGSRFKGGSDELVGTINQLFRITGSNIITTFINYRWNVHLSDTQNGFRALRREAAEAINLQVDGFPIETEMDIQLLQRRFRIGEVAAHEYARKGGESKIRLVKIWYQYPLLLLKTWFQPRFID
ncbi:glycosyltransferase family 2 protein [bacterium]|nr:glycosyltransferase family 2 protein [candidate division CSSED10-310 bacterium]